MNSRCLLTLAWGGIFLIAYITSLTVITVYTKKERYLKQLHYSTYNTVLLHYGFALYGDTYRHADAQLTPLPV